MITKKLLRVRIQQILRNTGLLSPVERLRYLGKLLQYRNKNRKFVRENPNFALPPAWLAFDAYSSHHWQFYKLSGEVTARFLTDILQKHFPSQQPNAIFEWGCGPGRVIRQMPAVLDERIELHASDYNPESIEWCGKHIPRVHFLVNHLAPPLPYPNQSFDFIYAISVFTHLSEKNCLDWIAELHRVMRPDGILLITTDSDSAYRKEMLPAEKKQYEEQGFIVRDRYEEGKKMFLARHSPRYIRETLLRQFTVLEHVPEAFPFMKQDYWIARKK